MMFLWLFRVAVAMVMMGLFALPFLRPAQPEFYVDVMGIAVNSVVAILSFLKIKNSRGGEGS